MRPAGGSQLYIPLAKIWRCLKRPLRFFEWNVCCKLSPLFLNSPLVVFTSNGNGGGRLNERLPLTDRGSLYLDRSYLKKPLREDKCENAPGGSSTENYIFQYVMYSREMSTSRHSGKHEKLLVLQCEIDYD